jgi:hypothetical protein
MVIRANSFQRLGVVSVFVFFNDGNGSRMSCRLQFIVVAVLLVPSLIVETATAQVSPLPSIELECSPVQVSVNVYPNATRSGDVTCIAINDSPYSEVVNITVEAGGHDHSSPGSITVPPNGQNEFEVTYRPEEWMSPQTVATTIWARVETANGFPMPTNISNSSDVNVDILMFAWPEIKLDTPYIQLQKGETVQVGVIVFNGGTGNGSFRMDIMNTAALKDSGLGAEITAETETIEAKGDPAKLNLRLIWEEGYGDKSYNVTVRAMSGSPSGDESFYTTANITVFKRTFIQDVIGKLTSPRVVFGGTGALLLLAGVLLVWKKRYAQDDKLEANDALS